MSDTLHVAVLGACGRNGQRVVALVRENRQYKLAAAVDAPTHPRQGDDIGTVIGVGPMGVPLVSGWPLTTRIDVVIDFSTPAASLENSIACVARRIPIVIATTGFTLEQRQRLEEAAHDTAILLAPNLSLAMNLLMLLLRQAAKALRGADYDVEIVERHHRFKKDSPSGTALHLAKIIQDEMGQALFRHGREGIVGERPLGEIGLHAVRTGDNVGEHTIIFSTLGETLELVHKAHTRDAYARGALHAAAFLAGKPAGWYEMKDVIAATGVVI